ncbi:MAG: type III ribulose-bisphosphate carboxylase [Candidatus Woesearchaeota archaeon]|nr:MAG: type III ribulose-bisphosphate carboxylase [Candidatus Woesearchaeota archaeon]
MTLEYIDLKYKPKRTDLVAEYTLKPAKGVSLREACEAIAGESSIGTWTDIHTLTPKIAKKLKPHVFSIKGNTIQVAYNEELFETKNIPQVLSSIAGNIFGMKKLESLRLEDIEFTKKLVQSFKGPRFGIQGIRKMTKVKKRPLVGTIVKPKLGLSASKHAKVAYGSWIGGCDIVKDDENLTSMSFNKFRERIRKTLEARKKAEKKTNEVKIYMPNVTAETKEMLKRAYFVKTQGGRYVMIDIMTCGWSALQTLRNVNLGLVIHAHRAMHAALTRNKEHGISMLTIAKVARLIGVDQLHIGTIVGKMAGPAVEVGGIEGEMEESMIKEKGHVLEQKWYGLKPTFAVCSGGLHPGLVDKLMEKLGKNIIIQAGGGIHGHPKGTTAGAKAMRQAVDAIMKKQTLRQYAKKHVELKQALDEWGS